MRWGIVGVGIAGRARCRAVHQVQHARLVGVHRGRFAGEVAAPELSAEQLFLAADVVAICSPSATHGAWIRRALLADCHVVVEYPLAASECQGIELFALAARRGRLLHVEHLELLSPTTAWMAKQVLRAGVREAAMSFSSRGEPFKSGREHAMSQVARLHRAIAVHGPIEAVDTHLSDGARLEARLEHAHGVVSSLSCRRGHDLERGLRWRVAVDGGAVLEIRGRSALMDGVEVHLEPTSLFLEDTKIATERLRGGRESYVDDSTVLAVLRCAECLGTTGRSEVSAGQA